MLKNLKACEGVKVSREVAASSSSIPSQDPPAINWSHITNERNTFRSKISTHFGQQTTCGMPTSASHTHQIHHHQGVEYLSSVTQRDYAVLRHRSALRKLESECLFCRRRRAKCLQPLMFYLPIERLAYKKPAFTNTGLDCFGPLHATVRRTTEKRWILIFTCPTTRAIHLEVLHSLNTSSCMMAIDRFVARRGRPDTDNGTNFASASKEVNTIEAPALPEQCAQLLIKWKFNAPSAPIKEEHGKA